MAREVLKEEHVVEFILAMHKDTTRTIYINNLCKCVITKK